ncbi:MAG TPA: hypothetical protein VHG28_19160 [Longimicrobiaceae bacterium]|nr:hypothetical protein [Longimicrobiaceae bacterium]
MREPGVDLLQRAAERAAERPAYLGWVLSRYLDLEGLDWPAVAAALGRSVDFAPLALCLRPRPDHFAADVRAVAERFDLDAGALARIVRTVDAVDAMAREAPQDRGALLAARERRREPKGDEGESTH